MDYKRLEEMLDIAKKVHMSLIPRINFNLEDKKHAIYLLQGGILTAVSNAITFIQGGYHAPASQQKRLIDEAINLIWFFDENDSQTRQIKAWFNGHVVEREEGNKGNLTASQRAKLNFLPEEEIKTMDEMYAGLSNITSKSMHPTLSTMRANCSKSTHLFDYDNLLPKKPNYSPRDFGNFFVIPALYSLLIPIRSLLVSEFWFNTLRAFISEIESS